MNREKILLIPAINIKNGVSRSFYFAKELSQYFDVYVTEWEDPQSVEFDNSLRGSKIHTLKCFFKSIFSKTTISKHPKYNYTVVKAPKLTLLVIHRMVGFVMALKIIRYFNSKVLDNLIKRIKPTVLFYADGCDFYPVKQNGFIVITDIQDDFSEGNFRDNHYQRKYGELNLNLAHKNYIVSKSAKTKLSEFYNTEFEYIPNGADYESMRAITIDDTNQLRKSLNLDGKLIVSFIGGGLWLDTPFSEKLFKQALIECPDVHFILIGNHGQINDSENVTNLGRMSNAETYKYYNLSDVGMFLKDSKGSPFLENSVPLKIIQYSAVNKYMITPLINWVDEEKFKNILLLKEFSCNAIIEQFKKIIKNGTIPPLEEKWNSYNWKEIVKHIAEFINAKRKEIDNNSITN